jgi:hypothetical protein
MTLEEKKYKLLSNKLSAVNDEIKLIVEKIKTTTDTSNIFWQKINKQIESKYEDLRTITAEWVNSEMPEIYQEYLNQQLTAIKYQDLSPMRKISYESFTNSGLKEQSIDKLMTSTLETYYKGYLQGETQLKLLANYTQIVNIKEEKIAGLISQGFQEKGTAQYSEKLLRNELLKIVDKNKFIKIIDKNGKQRNYKIDTYSELVTRTKFQDANTQAVVDTMRGIDADLIQISAHNTKTAYDAQFEGKIYSISGKDKDFPKVIDLPPFHISCYHSASIVFREGLEADGTLNKYIQYSNGNTEIHPTRRMHIPVSERTF